MQCVKCLYVCSFVFSIWDCVYVTYSVSDAQRTLLSIIQTDDRWPCYIKMQYILRWWNVIRYSPSKWWADSVQSRLLQGSKCSKWTRVEACQREKSDRIKIDSIHMLCFVMMLIIRKLHVSSDVHHTHTHTHTHQIKQAKHSLLNRQIHNSYFIPVEKFSSHTSDSLIVLEEHCFTFFQQDAWHKSQAMIAVTRKACQDSVTRSLAHSLTQSLAPYLYLSRWRSHALTRSLNDSLNQSLTQTFYHWLSGDIW